MPHRQFVAKELAQIFGVLSHPDRLRIVEELRGGESDVNSLREILDVPHSRVSQHLATMRAHRLVTERREGRHVYYRLQQPALATWVYEGLHFLEAEIEAAQSRREAVEEVRQLWSENGSELKVGQQ